MKIAQTTFASLLLPLFANAAPLLTEQTFTYKEVGGLSIKLDVHRPDDDTMRPVAIWIHGGALINGGREGIGRAGRMLLEEGFCVVSIDYRLAPETKMPGIYKDLTDAIQWIRENAGEKFRGDASRLVVLGGSAGGHLALTAGYMATPPPAAIVSFWGYGDVIGPWMSEPSPHERHQDASLSEAEIAAIESGPSVANSKDRKTDGAAYYRYCRKMGLWPQKVGGFDPHKQPEKFFPYMAVKNVTSEYPPTLLIHGTADTDVPFEQSVMMAEQFEKYGVPCQLIRVEGGEHGLRDAKPEDVNAAYDSTLKFIESHLPSTK